MQRHASDLLEDPQEMVKTQSRLVCKTRKRQRPFRMLLDYPCHNANAEFLQVCCHMISETCTGAQPAATTRAVARVSQR
jgi:hypothetical protein